MLLQTFIPDFIKSDTMKTCGTRILENKVKHTTMGLSNHLSMSPFALFSFVFWQHGSYSVLIVKQIQIHLDADAFLIHLETTPGPGPGPGPVQSCPLCF